MWRIKKINSEETTKIIVNEYYLTCAYLLGGKIKTQAISEFFLKIQFFLA